MTKLLSGGFPELTPEKQIIENNMKGIIKNTFEKFGYVNIETPAVELNSVLTSKGGDEVSKQIFGLYGLKQGISDLKDYSLHFDLTVPFARYVVDNEAELKFPFKRYQIQKAWRGERQQRGRFKEFTQCDVDVVGNNLSTNYDVEVIHTLSTTLNNIFEFLGIKKGIEVHLNNRKFIDSICNYYGIAGENIDKFYVLLDNYYKTQKDKFLTSLKEIVGDKNDEIINILNTRIDNLKFDDENLQRTFLELKDVYEKLKNKGVNVIFDPFITRGLDYYTGTVFETFISDYFDFGSICSGGKYDNLVEDIRKVSGSKGENYTGVGGSIGLTRLFSRLDDSGLLNKRLPLTDTIIFNIPGNDIEYKEIVGDILRQSDISTDIYYGDDKLGKQFAYAESKNIPFGIFAGGEEKQNNAVVVKNLDTRESEQVEISSLVAYIKEKLNKIVE